RGSAFDPGDYVYFLPESDGPCRFGMYNKYQRLVLDSFPEFGGVRLCSITTRDAYSLAGMLEDRDVLDFMKAAYFSIVVADILERLLWRIRPYEREPGTSDAFFERSMQRMQEAFESYGARKRFAKILAVLDEILSEARTIPAPGVPAKPLVGIVGEIYLRMHAHANQELIRLLERYGAEVVNASFAEWVNYITYDGLRNARTAFRLNLRRLRLAPLMESIGIMIHFIGDLLYKEYRQKQIYRRARTFVDLAEDHRIARLEEALVEEDLFTFDVGTETCLSIAGVVKYAAGGYNGVVNVYPFACMPSTTTTAVVKPLVDKLGLPFLDAPCDESIQPGREAAIRTFMYQAHQHFKKSGKGAGRDKGRSSGKGDGAGTYS
ncbi:MAG: CoA activase, partial [Deltaproteobacteria bacterium]|nr:CoA activase [Deltaproteobacteria bacterium]